MTQPAALPADLQDALNRLPGLPLAEMAPVARAVNARNGFCPTFTLTDLPTRFALVHTEITEAWREVFPGALDRARFVRELGDVIVRLLDTAELLSPGALAEQPTLPVTSGGSFFFMIAEELMRLHAHVDDAMEAYRKAPAGQLVPEVIAHLWAAAGRAAHIIVTFGMDPQATVANIIQANARRPFQHGGRRA